MNLKEEILSERAKEREEEEKRKAPAANNAMGRSPQKKSAPLRAKEQKKEIAVQKKQNRLKEKEFVKNVKAGNVPEEWNTMYGKLYAEIKKDLLENGRNTFGIRIEVEKSYFSACTALRKVYKSDAVLMAKFFERKLVKEGLKIAECTLSYVPEYYETEEDRARQKREQARAEAQAERDAQAENDRAWQRYRDDCYYAMMNNSSNTPTPPPIYVSGMGASRVHVPVRATGIIEHYYWIVKGKMR